MAVVIRVTSNQGNAEVVESCLSHALREERKRFEFALHRTQERLKEFEGKFKKKTSKFLQEFKSGAIEENPEVFEWWAEAKLLEELQKGLEVLKTIEVCRE